MYMFTFLYTYTNVYSAAYITVEWEDDIFAVFYVIDLKQLVLTVACTMYSLQIHCFMFFAQFSSNLESNGCLPILQLYGSALYNSLLLICIYILYI